MVTLEQWKEFQEYRREKSSKIYSEMDKKISLILEPKQKKFLFWEYKKYPCPFFSLTLLKMTREYYESVIPKNTVEACMDWLLSKKEKQNDPPKHQ